MKERPILFSTPMVQALLDNRKTQTRRIIKPQPVRALPQEFIPMDQAITRLKTLHQNGNTQIMTSGPLVGQAVPKCPYGEIGDRLWVRETFYAYGHWTDIKEIPGKEKSTWYFNDLTLDYGKSYMYEDNPPEQISKRRFGLGYYKRPSIHMPRVASRILLENTGFRAEQLMDISEADAIAEGIKPWIGEPGKYENYGKVGYISLPPITSFFSLWNSINGDESLNFNPWVWAITFKKI